MGVIGTVGFEESITQGTEGPGLFPEADVDPVR